MNNFNDIIAGKFGGTSNADAGQCKKTADIICANPNMRAIIVSAPANVTELLLYVYDCIQEGKDWNPAWMKIEQIFVDIIHGLELDQNLLKLVSSVEGMIKENPDKDFISKQGEYLQSQIMADILRSNGKEAIFVDSKDCVFFGVDGEVDEKKTYAAILEKIPEKGYVVFPGFYGTDVNGKIKTFSRGGSDLTGALVAAALHCTFIKWTDVAGIYSSDPKRILNAKPIREMTYEECRILTHAGAKVFHSNTFTILSESGVTVWVKDVNNPEAPGTRVVPTMNIPAKSLVGVVGDIGFSVLAVKKMGAHEEKGFGKSILDALVELEISYAFELPSGLDISVLAIKTKDLAGRHEKLIAKIMESTKSKSVTITDNVGVINAITYQDTDYTDTLTALQRSGIKLKSKIHAEENGQMIITVAQEDTFRAVEIIHDRFFPY